MHSSNLLSSLFYLFRSTTVYTAVADLVHHVKSELTASQLERIVHVYSSMMHNPAFGYNLHTLFAKMMFGLADVIVAKETSQGAARLLETMFETCLEKLEGLCVVQADVSAILERNKQKDFPVHQDPDATAIEKARPIGGAVNYIEKPEDILVGKFILYIACKSVSYDSNSRIPDGFQDITSWVPSMP